MSSEMKLNQAIPDSKWTRPQNRAAKYTRYKPRLRQRRPRQSHSTAFTHRWIRAYNALFLMKNKCLLFEETVGAVFCTKYHSKTGHELRAIRPRFQMIIVTAFLISKSRKYGLNYKSFISIVAVGWKALIDYMHADWLKTKDRDTPHYSDSLQTREAICQPPLYLRWKELLSPSTWCCWRTRSKSKTSWSASLWYSMMFTNNRRRTGSKQVCDFHNLREHGLV